MTRAASRSFGSRPPHDADAARCGGRATATAPVGRRAEASRPHLPMRPLWRCRRPCVGRPGAPSADGAAGRAGAQTRLNGRPADLHERFLGWARGRGGTMFHVNHEPGAEIHHTDPFATPDRAAFAGTPAARPAARGGDAVDGGPGRPGLTVSSTLVADGEPGRLLGLVDDGVRPVGGASRSRAVRGRAARPGAPAARRPVRRPVARAGRALRRRRVDRDAVRPGPGRRRRAGPAAGWTAPGSTAGRCWSRPRSRRSTWPTTRRRCCTTAVGTGTCRLTASTTARPVDGHGLAGRDATSARRTA